MNYLTADLHLAHKNIMAYTKRPYKNIDVMYAAIVKAFKKVKPEDHVYILGDVTFNNACLIKFFNDVPKANYYLVKGNHDKDNTINNSNWVWAKDLATVNLDGSYVTLCHYPLGAWIGNYHVHGHTHGTYWRTKPNMYDVGPDAAGAMKLWKWQDLKAVMDKDIQAVNKSGNYNKYNKNYTSWI